MNPHGDVPKGFAFSQPCWCPPWYDMPQDGPCTQRHLGPGPTFAWPALYLTRNCCCCACRHQGHGVTADQQGERISVCEYGLRLLAVAALDVRRQDSGVPVQFVSRGCGQWLCSHHTCELTGICTRHRTTACATQRLALTAAMPRRQLPAPLSVWARAAARHMTLMRSRCV